MNAYLEGGYDRSESTTVGYFYYGARPIILKAANNPFGKDIYVNFPASVTGNAESKAVNEGTRIAGGFTYDAFSDWVLAGDYSWSKTEINSIYPRGYGVGPGMGDIGIAEAANSGKLNVLRDTTSFSLTLYNLLVMYQLLLNRLCKIIVYGEMGHYLIGMREVQN
ncbi:hypothetical protein PYR76_18430 (plasmid) [Acinetobacter soli]|nr:hypothetical protein [Acinetobacter soli]WEH90971.1 hypothetical protein PYR75_00245 [Acinetobacter soli]WEH99299.1 hypothetical protein PYR76_18430 [Acinetobacter soli]